jgi:hypothetical protein
LREHAALERENAELAIQELRGRGDSAIHRGKRGGNRGKQGARPFYRLCVTVP